MTLDDGLGQRLSDEARSIDRLAFPAPMPPLVSRTQEPKTFKTFQKFTQDVERQGIADDKSGGQDSRARYLAYPGIASSGASAAPVRM
jgi:hypothetical protein